jgi:hypothetical protein
MGNILSRKGGIWDKRDNEKLWKDRDGVALLITCVQNIYEVVSLLDRDNWNIIRLFIAYNGNQNCKVLRLAHLKKGKTLIISIKANNTRVKEKIPLKPEGLLNIEDLSSVRYDTTKNVLDNQQC